MLQHCLHIAQQLPSCCSILQKRVEPLLVTRVEAFGEKAIQLYPLSLSANTASGTAAPDRGKPAGSEIVLGCA